MGIGISFTGRDGVTRTMQAESPAEVRSLLERTLGANTQAMESVGRRQARNQQHTTNVTNILNHIQKMGGGMGGGGTGKGDGAVTLDPNGSLTEGLQGLALKGDMPDGMARLQVYGESDDGKRGFWYLEDFDPAAEAGALVGGNGSSQSEDADVTERKPKERTPFSLTVVSRIAIVEDENLPSLVRVYFFVRNVSFTGFGRVCRVSGETRIPLGMLNLSGGGGDGGGGGVYIQPPSVYDIETDGNGDKIFTNRWYMVGGVLKDGPNGTVSGFAGKVVAILIQQNENTVTLQAFNNIAAMQLAMADQTKVVIPLYVLDENCEITLDLRHIPIGDLWNIGGVS